MRKNRKKTAFLVKKIVDEHYIPQSHRGCLVDVYRRHVSRVYPMSVAAFYRLIEYAVGVDGYIGNGSNRVLRPKKTAEDDSDNQLKLF